MIVEIRKIPLTLFEKLLRKGLGLEVKHNREIPDFVILKQKKLISKHLNRYRLYPDNFILCVFEEKKNYITSFNGGFRENDTFYFLYLFNLSPSLNVLDLILTVAEKAEKKFGNLKAKIVVNKESRFKFYKKYLEYSDIKETSLGMEITATLAGVTRAIKKVIKSSLKNRLEY